MKNLMLITLFIVSNHSITFAADLNVSCRPPFSQKIERLDVVKENNQFTVSFDFEAAEGFNCIDSTTNPEFKGIVKCSHDDGTLIQIDTTETGFTDGTLVMSKDHVTSGILCFLIQ